MSDRDKALAIVADAIERMEALDQSEHDTLAVLGSLCALQGAMLMGEALPFLGHVTVYSKQAIGRIAQVQASLN